MAPAIVVAGASGKVGRLLATTSDVVRRIGGVEPDAVRPWIATHPDRLAVTGDRDRHRPH
jgi:hypothetical protein